MKLGVSLWHVAAGVLGLGGLYVGYHWLSGKVKVGELALVPAKALSGANMPPPAELEKMPNIWVHVTHVGLGTFDGTVFSTESLSAASTPAQQLGHLQASGWAGRPVSSTMSAVLETKPMPPLPLPPLPPATLNIPLPI